MKCSLSVCCCAVLSHSVVSSSLWCYGLQPSRLLCLWRFSRQEYWSGLPCPPPGDLPKPGMEPRYLALQADSLRSEPPGKPENPGVGSLSLLQGNFPTQKLNRVSCIAGGCFTSYATRESSFPVCLYAKLYQENNSWMDMANRKLIH